jgi:uncharacterized protein with GYD domain
MLMTLYLARAKISKEAMKALVDKPEDRLITTTRFLKGIGGRLHSYYFSFGEYDIVLIFELEDHVSAAVLSMVLTSSGSCTEVDTTVLLSMAEAVDAMNKAGDAMGVYRPPGRSEETGPSKSTRRGRSSSSLSQKISK